MGLRFIFMLTRNDRTVEDAPEQLKIALSLGVRHIGFKDIGLPIDRLEGPQPGHSVGRRDLLSRSGFTRPQK